MRIVLIVILCATSVCLAQESYHNDEFGFTIEVPVGWNISLENQWSDKVKEDLEKLYSNKTLLILNPPGVEIAKPPCVHVQGIKLENTTTSEMVKDLKEKGKERLIKYTGYNAGDMLGRKIDRYSKIDTYYNYDSFRKVAIAKILYKNNEEGSYVLVIIAKIVGQQRVVDFNGYWKGDNPQEFWKEFTGVIDSFKFDQNAKPKWSFSGLSKKQKFDLIWKWGGIILTISIVIGVVRYMLGR